MTASSFDIFPCRVQLMGLPQSSNSSLSTTNNFVRPPVAKIHGISRNLFGSPDPGEMKALYQKESARMRSYVLQRYNIDTNTIKPTKDNEQKQQPDKVNTSQTTNIFEMQPTQMPTLIEQEMRQHEHRLGDSHSHDKTFPETKQKKEKNFNKDKYSQTAHTCKKLSSILSPAIERKKQFKRQSLLKESFNIRKNRVYTKKIGQHSNFQTIPLKNSQNSHRNVEILSHRINLQKGTFDIQERGDKLLTCDQFISQQLAEVEEKSRIRICSDNCATTLSLQLVVSPQKES